MKGITHENESLIDPDDPSRYRTMPLLEDVYNILMEAPETKRMGNILNRLVHGSAKTFNQQTNVDLSNPYTVLDISELTGELLTVGMFLVLDFVWDKAKEDRTKEKAIFIDEIWQLVGAGDTVVLLLLQHRTSTTFSVWMGASTVKASSIMLRQKSFSI